MNSEHHLLTEHNRLSFYNGETSAATDRGCDLGDAHLGKYR